MTHSLGTIPEFQAHCLGNLSGGASSEILAEKAWRLGLLTQTSVHKNMCLGGNRSEPQTYLQVEAGCKVPSYPLADLANHGDHVYQSIR